MVRQRFWNGRDPGTPCDQWQVLGHDQIGFRPPHRFSLISSEREQYQFDALPHYTYKNLQKDPAASPGPWLATRVS